MVPCLPGRSDWKVALAINTPLLAPLDIHQPNKTQIINMFSAAVPPQQPNCYGILPRSCSIYTEQQLFERLGDLVVKNMEVEKWEIRMTPRIDGYGGSCIEKFDNACAAFIGMNEDVKCALLYANRL